MAMEDKAIIPGKGFVLVGDVDAAVPDIGAIDLNDPSTFTGFEWLGHTSRENTVALSKEGGESTALGSWEEPALRQEFGSSTWGMTVNALNVTQQTLSLAMPNGNWDEANESFGFGGNLGSTSRSILVVMEDNKNGRAAIYFPNGAISLGEAPSISVESFFEIQLNVAGQGSPSTGDTMRWFTPRPVTAPIPTDPEAGA